jgi:hypothetical protein
LEEAKRKYPGLYCRTPIKRGRENRRRGRKEERHRKKWWEEKEIKGKQEKEGEDENRVLQWRMYRGPKAFAAQAPTQLASR